MKYNLSLIAIVMAFAAWVITLYAAPAGSTTSGGTAVLLPPKAILDFDRLGRMERSDLEDELNRTAADRITFQTQLIVQLRAPSSKQARLVAIFFLGFYRMEGAVPDLSRIIDLRDDAAYDITKHLPLWGEYPAANALGSIGDPAIPEMIRNLTTSDDPTVRQLSAVVLRSVLGPALAKEAVRENIAVRQGKDNEGVARLKAAIPLIEMPSPSTQPRGTAPGA